MSPPGISATTSTDKNRRAQKSQMLWTGFRISPLADPWQCQIPSCTRARVPTAALRGPGRFPGTSSGSHVATDRICIPVLESFGDNIPEAIRALNVGPSAGTGTNLWDFPGVPPRASLSLVSLPSLASSASPGLPGGVSVCPAQSQDTGPAPPAPVPAPPSSPGAHMNTPWSFLTSALRRY